MIGRGMVGWGDERGKGSQLKLFSQRLLLFKSEFQYLDDDVFERQDV